MNRCLFVLIPMLTMSACTSHGAAIQTAAGLGCNVTPERAQHLVESACANAAAGSYTMGGYATDASMREQNAPPTADVSVPITMPNGAVAAELVCDISTRHKSVVYASATKGPTTKEEAEYLRTLGACAD